MKKRKWQRQGIVKIKIQRNGKPPISIDIIEALQPFIQLVPARQLSLFLRTLTKSFSKMESINEADKQFYADNFKHVRRLQIFLRYIDHFYDQSELKTGGQPNLPSDEYDTGNPLKIV